MHQSGELEKVLEGAGALVPEEAEEEHPKTTPGKFAEEGTVEDNGVVSQSDTKGVEK